MRHKGILVLAALLVIMTITNCQNSDNNPVQPAPSPPTNLVATALSHSTVRLLWEVPDILTKGCRIERTLADPDNWQVIALLAERTTAYLDTGLSEGTTYSYRILAFGKDRDSDFSNIATVTTEPKAPANLHLITTSGSMIHMRWIDQSDVETGYEIQRRRGNNGTYEHLTTTPENTTEFRDENLNRNVRYYYRVRAEMHGTTSAWANELTAPTVAEPTDLLGMALSDTSVWLGWRDNSTFETGYCIERSVDDDNDWAILTNLASNMDSYTDNAVQEGNVYYYRVSSLFDEVSSPPTDAVVVRTPPAAPVALEAVQDAEADTVIHLGWVDRSHIETGFDLQRRDYMQYEFKTIAMLASDAEQFADTGLQPNSSYTYRVRTCHDTSCSDWSNEASANTTVLTPLQPTDLLAEVMTPTQVRLSWLDNSNNEDGQVIERKTGQADWTTADSLPRNDRRHFDTGLTPETTYLYRIYAWNEYGASPYSNIADVTTPQDVPAAPSNLNARDVSFHHVILGWQDNSNNEVGFRIIRRRVPLNFYDSIGEVTYNTTIFVDTSVITNTEYGYRVSAFNATGESNRSQELLVSVPPGPPGAPQYLNVRATAWNSVAVSWSRTSNDEDGFLIGRRGGQDANFTIIGETGPGLVIFQDTGLEGETWYWYRIQAYNAYGDSDYSNVDSVQTPIHALFHDSFEDYEAGAAPHGNGWEAERRGNSFVAVTTADAHEGEQSVLFNDAVNEDSSFCRLMLDHELLQRGSFECWLKIAPEGYYCVIGADEQDYITFQIQFNPDGSIFVRTRTLMVLVQDYTYPRDEWFSLGIFFNTDYGVYSINLNDDFTIDGLELQRGNLHEANELIVFCTYPDATLDFCYLDDVILREGAAEGSSPPLIRTQSNIFEEGLKKLSDIELHLP